MHDDLIAVVSTASAKAEQLVINMAAVHSKSSAVRPAMSVEIIRAQTWAMLKAQSHVAGCAVRHDRFSLQEKLEKFVLATARFPGHLEMFRLAASGFLSGWGLVRVAEGTRLPRRSLSRVGMSRNLARERPHQNARKMMACPA